MIEDALTAFDANIEGYPNSGLERDGLYGKFLLALYTEKDTSDAASIQSTITTRFPESDEAYVSSHQLSTFMGTATLQMFGQGKRLSDADRSDLPFEVRLSQNYPNPFNPSTTLSFEVPRTAHVRLSVYSVLGENVRTLIDDTVEAGTRRVVWDGTNDHGSLVVSGVYFYRLETVTFSSTRKMMLLK